ncbi:DUF1071 domain-containing protein [Segatella sp.]|uniref:Sak single strand annealing protein n=1 Tax=Segatella sp. TaxID=2974253 RepID=UPI003AB7A444
MDNYFTELYGVNVNGHTENKNNLKYLSWAWAWGEIKKRHPDATYTVYENADGWNYHTDGRTCWVKTGVTVNGIEHIEYLPVMDYKNKSIPVENVTSFDVNKAIQRSLTKACARHGLGLYIYAGEDLPEEEAAEKQDASRNAKNIAANNIISGLAKVRGKSDGEILNALMRQISKPEGTTIESLEYDDLMDAIKILNDWRLKVDGSKKS